MSILAFLRKPLVLQGVQVFTIMGAGDLIAQSVIEKKPSQKLDWNRTIKFACVGLFVIGPCLHTWFGFLDKLVAPKQSAFKRGLKKMALDQCLFAPGFCAGIVCIFGKLNHESNKDILQRLNEDLPDIMIRNYLLWPPAQIINFSLVPVQHQVIFAQCIAVIWNIYMSLVLNKTTHNEPVFVNK